MIHYISSERLTIERVGEIITKNMRLALSEESVERITRCRRYLDDKISECDHPIYGITTGFGSLCNISIDTQDLSTLQENRADVSHTLNSGTRALDMTIRSGVSTVRWSVSRLPNHTAISFTARRAIMN